MSINEEPQLEQNGDSVTVVSLSSVGIEVVLLGRNSVCQRSVELIRNFSECFLLFTFFHFHFLVYIFSFICANLYSRLSINVCVVCYFFVISSFNSV